MIEWKDVPLYEGIYFINNKGEIKNANNLFIKYVKNTSGYYKVNLCNKGKQKTLMVHQVMALTFFENYELGRNKFVIDHKDNNKLNNDLDNLQIISFRENVSKDRKNCTSKYTGVSLRKKDGKWNSYIRIGNKNKFLGAYETEIEAHEVYKHNLKNLNI